MDRQIPNISIHDLLQQMSTSESLTAEDGAQLSYLLDSEIAVNIEANAGRVMAAFVDFPIARQFAFVKFLLKRLPKNGDTMVLNDDVFSGKSALVMRVSGDERNVRFRFVHF